MAKVNIHTRKVHLWLIMTADGQKTRNMVKANKYIKMVPHMRESGHKIESMAEAYSSSLMVIVTMVSGKMEGCME